MRLPARHARNRIPMMPRRPAGAFFSLTMSNRLNERLKRAESDMVERTRGAG
jgi:hypothetical protein